MVPLRCRQYRYRLQPVCQADLHAKAEKGEQTNSDNEQAKTHNGPG